MPPLGEDQMLQLVERTAALGLHFPKKIEHFKPEDARLAYNGHMESWGFDKREALAGRGYTPQSLVYLEDDTALPQVVDALGSFEGRRVDFERRILPWKLARTYMSMPHMASSGCWSDTGEDNGVVLVYFRPSCGRRALTDLARWLICQ